MIESLRPATAVGVCFLAAGLILLLGNHLHRNLREAITISAAVCAAGLVFPMTPAVLNGQVYEARLWQIAEGVELAFRTDAAGMVFACIASFLWILTSFYSIGYMRGHHEKNQTGYFAAFAVCVGSALGIAMAANLMTFFIFYEMLTIATYPLVAHYRNDAAKMSGRKYLAYTLISGQLFFAAICVVYVLCGSGDFAAGGFLAEAAGEALPSNGALCVLFLLMILGGAVKAGVMPLHSWLPSAMVAPTPVSALLHAVAVVKAGAFCVLRVVGYVFGPQLAIACGGAKILAWAAAFTIILSSLLALKKDNLKARLAFSTVGQLSYIVMGICVCAQASIAGALFHMAAHAFLKITLFMCAGAIFVTTGLSEISSMRGLAKRMPATMTCFAIASLGIAGLPLMAGFVSKFNLIRGILAMGQPFFAVVLVAAALLALSYLMPVVQIMFAKGEGPDGGPLLPAADAHGHAYPDGGDVALTMRIPLMLTTAAAVMLGCMPNAGPHLYTLVQMAAAAVTEGGAFLAG